VIQAVWVMLHHGDTLQGLSLKKCPTKTEREAVLKGIYDLEEQIEDIKNEYSYAADSPQRFCGQAIVVDSHEVDKDEQDFKGRTWLETKLHNQESVGFDMEWLPDVTKGSDNPVALMQFADEETALPLRTHKAEGWLPQSVIELPTSPDAIKVTTGFDGSDSAKMKATFNVEPEEESSGLSEEGDELEMLRVKISVRKDELKASGMSASHCNKDEKVQQWVARIQELQGIVNEEAVESYKTQMQQENVRKKTKKKKKSNKRR